MANGQKLVWWWGRVWGPGLSEAVRFKLGWEGWVGDSQERRTWEPWNRAFPEAGSAGVSLKSERVCSLGGPRACGDKLEGSLREGPIRAAVGQGKGLQCTLSVVGFRGKDFQARDDLIPFVLSKEVRGQYGCSHLGITEQGEGATVHTCGSYRGHDGGLRGGSAGPPPRLWLDFAGAVL